MTHPALYPADAPPHVVPRVGAERDVGVVD